MSTLDEVAEQLSAHEAASDRRYESLKSESEHQYRKLKHCIEKEMEMSETPHIKNIFEPGAGYPMAALAAPYAGLGTGAGGLAGAGAGILGGILGGALLSRGGLFGGCGPVGVEGFGFNRGWGGGWGVEGIVTPMQLQTATGSIIDSAQNTAVLQGLGDIKGAIPLAEAQAQLAIAGATAEVRSHLGQVENAVLLGQNAINKNVSDAIAASLASQNNININVLQSACATREAVNMQGQANLMATKDALAATQAAICASTREIVDTINSQNLANLQRQLTVAENALLEQRADSRARGTEVNVTQMVNQTQQQAQLQQQQQQQTILLDRLFGIIGNLQNAVATNSNLIVGNTGAVATGPQTANPVNVRA